MNSVKVPSPQASINSLDQIKFTFGAILVSYTSSQVKLWKKETNQFNFLTDGAGLFCGVIRSFLARKEACPRVLVATHFHDIFRSDLLDPALPITFLHMQILLPEMPADNGDIVEEDEAQLGMHSMRNENITYLYRFAIHNSKYTLT